MPTSYTSLLGLALPVTGELSGTWGDEVNNYITQYLDAAVAGTQTISGSQTAVTLSKTTGSGLSQAGSGATGSAQYQIINCTGNPGSQLTITAPAASRAYLVLNNTSTAQAVKIVGTGPTTGVTVASAHCALVAWNGSDFELVATTDASKLTGVLAVANGGTGATTLTGVLIGNGTSAITTKTNPTGAFVGTTDAQTLTSKTFQAYSEVVNTIGTISTATYTLDTSAANIFDLTLGTNVTITFSNAPAAGSSRPITLIVRQPSSSPGRTLTVTGARYTDGTAPVLSTGANQVDVLTYWTIDGGTTYFGTFAMANVS